MFQARRRNRQGTQRTAAAFHPGVELLEDRTLLSVGLIADVNKTTQSAFPPGPAQFSSAHAGAWTYFTATDGKQVNELWRSDGTGSNTFLVKVIGGPADSPSTIENITALGSRVVFTADDGIHGNELWISDGTARGTRLLLDINKNTLDGLPAGSDARDFVSAGSHVFFTAVTSPQGRELWVTDGTAQGTYIVRDLDPFNTEPYSDGPSHLTAFGSRVVFYARDEFNGRELWISDGTKQGTRIVRDINRGTGDGAPSAYSNDGSIAVVGGTVYFTADNGLSGPELWKTDGTWRGTNIVRDIHPGQVTADNTSMDVGSSPQSLTGAGGVLFFTADDGKHGRALWKSDGTRTGTKLVASSDMPGFAGMQEPHQLAAFDYKLAFLATTDSGSQALWVSAGTTATTRMLKEIAPQGSPIVWASIVPWMPNAQDLFAVDGTLYFTAIDAASGRELWKTDGTPGGTSLVRDIRPGQAGSQITFLAAQNHRLLFIANDGKTGRELWTSDGSPNNTKRVRDINRQPGDSNPQPPVQIGSTLYFSADDGVHGAELWKSDGTSAGTKLVKDINPDYSPSWTTGGDTEPAGSNIHALAELNGLLYFVADDGIHGDELWVSDGTSAGTHLVEDVNTQPPYFWQGGDSAGSSIGELIVMDGSLYFVADDGEHGRELWTSDGTAPGTHLVEDINTHDGFGPIPVLDPPLPLDAPAPVGMSFPWWTTGNASSDPAELTVFGGNLYFSADDGDRGRELWRSDGTPEGTKLVADLHAESSNPANLTLAGAWLFFTADDGTHGTELWRTNGTESGTQMVRDVNPTSETPSWTDESFPGSSYPSSLTAVGSLLYFVANDGQGTGLWKTDGTKTGTSLVRSFATSAEGIPASVYELTAAGNTLYFISDADGTGAELWTSDGTSRGTHLVSDLFPGSSLDPYAHALVPNSSSPSNLVFYHGRLYFIAEDGEHGRELWSSDGTSMGTRLEADLLPGRRSGFGWQSGLGVFGDTLYLCAADALSGVELRYLIEPLVA